MAVLTLWLLQWKFLVVDEASKKIVDNVATQDDILNINVTGAHAPPCTLLRLLREASDPLAQTL